MFNISKKKSLVRLSLISAVIAIVSLATVFVAINNQDNSSAVTPDGGKVRVAKKAGKGDLNYGDTDTHWYLVTPNVTPDITYDAYCAEPEDHDPVGSNKTARILSGENKYDKIKLMIYIREHNDATTQDIREHEYFFGVIRYRDYWGKNQTNRVYAYTHAVIGAIYDGSYHGLNSAAEGRIRNASSYLQTLINANHPAWQAASQYTLFRARPSESKDQDVVWIEPPEGVPPVEPEPEEPTGSITIQKCDSEISGSCTTQGNASFDGITFQLYSGDYLLEQGTLENGANTISFGELEINKTYTIVESTGSNVSYNLGTSTQQVGLDLNSLNPTVTFTNPVKRGSLTINKTDKETGTCESSIEGNFAGTSLQLINTSRNAIYYNGNLIGNGQTVDTRTFSASDCSATFSNLPYGTYSYVETASATGYVKDSTPHNITIPTGDNYSVSSTLANQPIRGDVKFVKMDNNNSRPIANALFTISALNKNNQIKETHILVTNSQGVINTSASFNLHSNHTNEYDALYDMIESRINYLGYGSWFGKKPSGQQTAVDDSVGALPFGTYIIQEIRCDYNLFCYDLINENKTITISQHNQVIDLGEWDNDCTKFSVDTIATDYLDGDKFLRAGKETAVKDVITYCARKNVEFTIVGTIMDKDTNSPLIINGEKVEQSITFTPEENCGTLEMVFPFDTTELVGKSVVAFEKLYYKDIEEASHEDINSPEQTVDIIEMTTKVENNENDNKIFAHGPNTRIVDTVDYCLKPGLEFTIKGTVMNKATGEKVLVDNSPVVLEKTFTPTKRCDKLEMTYEFDTTSLAGAELVIFTELYTDGNLILENKDLDDEDETFEIEFSVDTIATDYLDGDKFLRAGKETAIKDVITYCARKNIEVTIVGTIMDKETNTPLTINGEKVEQSITFTPEENCGTIEMIFPFDTTELIGKSVVAFEKMYHENIEKGSHEDINAPEQTVDIIELTTKVENNDDGNKTFAYDTDIKVVDTVDYCLKPGLEYTIKGIVMDKATGNGILVDSKSVVSEKTFTPTERCGKFEMTYEFNTANLAGAQLVIYTYLYTDGELILENKDLNDENESFIIKPLPAPDTGVLTKENTGDHAVLYSSFIAIGVVTISPICYYVIRRRSARKRFYND